MHLARIEQGERTRAQLVEAARRLLVEHGAEGMSLQRVAHEVGVTVGAVQSHFKSKTGLLLAVLERSQSLAQDRWMDALGRLARSSDWVGDLVGVLWELSSDDLIIAMQQVQSAARQDPDVARRLQEITATDFMTAQQIATALGIPSDEEWEMSFAAVGALVHMLAQARAITDPRKTALMLERLQQWADPLLRR